MAVTIKARIVQNDVEKQFPGFRRKFPDVVDAALGAAALRIDAAAKRSIFQGPKTGRVYKRRSVTHQASAPGEAPAHDTGDLTGHIFRESGRGFAFVGATVLHGLYLEEGTDAIEPRPWLGPALDADGDKLEADLLRRLEAL